MKRTIFGTSALLMAMTACAAHEEANGESEARETASYLAALEVNEDGADVQVADAIGDEPRLMRGCRVHAVREQLRRDFDSDEDGELTRPERAEMRDHFGGPRRGERRMRFELIRESYDLDADGDLDEAERDALEADLDARCERKLAELVARFDTDESGDLDDTEWEAAHAAIRARFEEHHQQLVARFDADGSGDLDDTERQAARAAIAEQIDRHRGHMPKHGFGPPPAEGAPGEGFGPTEFGDAGAPTRTGL